MKPRIASRLSLPGSLLVLLLVMNLEASGQHRPTYPHPPQAADTTPAQSVQPQIYRPRANPAQLHQEVQELSNLTAHLAQDVESINRGLLPKDTVSKLKRVEALAKHMRREIAP